VDDDEEAPYQIKDARQVLDDFTQRCAELLERRPVSSSRASVDARLANLQAQHAELMTLTISTVRDLGFALVGISDRVALLETRVHGGVATASFAPDLEVVPDPENA
jgi:hypothetical protein